MHHQHPVAVLDRIAQIVCHHNSGEPLFLYNTVRQLHYDLGCLRIQSRRMFIENQEIDRRHGGHQKRHSLPLSAGQSADFYIHLIFQSKI